MRLIDADEIKQKLQDGYKVPDLFTKVVLRNCETLIDECQTINPTQHACWNYHPGSTGASCSTFDYWECSNCNYKELINAIRYNKYCPNCGCRMDGET